MKKFAFACVVLVLFAAPAWAQRATPGQLQPRTTPTAVMPAAVTPPTLFAPPAATTTVEVVRPAISTSVGELKATPEMWFYEQYVKEYKDPKNAVRSNAEFAAQQRAKRLAAQRWFGFSNARPRLSADPINNYPPTWSSNTPLQPNRWQGTGSQSYYVARPENSDVRPY